MPCRPPSLPLHLILVLLFSAHKQTYRLGSRKLPSNHPVNLLCVDNIDRQDEIINQAFELLGDEIAVVHCKDYVVEGNELKSIAAGTGSLNYPLLLKKIKEHKPYVHCTLENTVPENAAATKEFMEKTYASV